jgi:hypothetical protein
MVYCLISAPHDTQFDFIDLVGKAAGGHGVDVFSKGI